MSEVITRLENSTDPVEVDLARTLRSWQNAKRLRGEKATLGYEPRDINELGAVEVISRRVRSQARGFQDIDVENSYESIVDNHSDRFPDDVVELARKRVSQHTDSAHEVRAYLLIWNPNNWEWHRDDLDTKIEDIRRGRRVVDRWSCGNSKNIRVGDQIYLMRLGKEPRGIFGVGTVVRSPYEDVHWNVEKQNRGELASYVDFAYETLLDPEVDMILSRSFLKSDPDFSIMHWDSQLSGISIKSEIIGKLESEWRSLVGEVLDILPEQISNPDKYVEGAKRQVTVNGYERNAAARRKCVEHYGPVCVVCGFDFEEIYGSAAAGIIHVHHLIPLADIGNEYEIDPISDLRPVCPNCHAVIHSKKEPYSIDDVTSFLDSGL